MPSGARIQPVNRKPRVKRGGGIHWRDITVKCLAARTLKGQLGRVATAEQLFDQALQFQMSGRLQEAEGLYRAVLDMDPEQAVVHFNLGIVLRHQGRLAEAAESYLCALARQPEFPEAENNLGTTLVSLGRMDEAVGILEALLERKPDFANAWNNLGGALKDLGRTREALRCFERATRLQPANAAFHSNLVFAMHYSPDHGPKSLLREAKRWNRIHAGVQMGDTPPHQNDRSPERRLRVGYVSAHFRDHCQALFLTPLLSHHDRSCVEVTCYSDAVAEDAVTRRLRGLVDRWRPTAELSDEGLAELVRADGIDVLVDLSLHMARQRLLVLARRPAPVQVAWLGYPGTTGMEAVDCRFTDPWLDPQGVGDEAYAEESVRLPDTFWCYDPLAEGPEVNELPALASGRVTFGCLNNFCKVNPGVLHLWRRVLERVPGSRMTLLVPPGDARRRVLRELGVGAERVGFVEFALRPDYLRRYLGIDLCLDTTPYNGHTTTLDSLWMGVPVVSLSGETVVSRAGRSMLGNLGLGELAVGTADAFVETAAGLATDLPRLAALRAGLRGRMQASPLMDGTRFARGLEEAYRTLWRRWCARAPAGGLSARGARS